MCKQAGCGTSARSQHGSLHQRVEGGPFFFYSGSNKKHPSTGTEMVSPPATAKLRLKHRWRGHNLSRQTPTNRPPEDQKTCPDPQLRELRNLEVPPGPGGRGGGYRCKCEAERQPCLKSCQGEGELASTSELTDLTDSQVKGDWTLISAQSRTRSLPPTPKAPLHNRRG